MSMTDPIADMLTRIRNAQSARFNTVDVMCSKLSKAVLDVLKDEGYIKDISSHTNEKKRKMYRLVLKYTQNEPVIKVLKRISKPGQRRYTDVKNMPKVLNGLGIAILSTPKGVMSDGNARYDNVGGEVLCYVY